MSCQTKFITNLIGLGLRIINIVDYRMIREEEIFHACNVGSKDLTKKKKEQCNFDLGFCPKK